MDFTESTRVAFDRIKALEPENATKIMGYLLLQDGGDQQMIHLASSSDIIIQELVYKAKSELQNLQNLGLKSTVTPTVNSVHIPERFSQFSLFSPVSPQRHLSPPNFGGLVSRYCWEPQVKSNPGFSPLSLLDSIDKLRNRTQFLNLDDQTEPANLENPVFLSEHSYPDAATGILSARTECEFPVKTCHYFNKGFCRHGNNCRFFHGQLSSDSLHQMFGHNLDEDNVFSSASLEKLELEIVELLKSRRGAPVSIASLPLLYYEKFGKVFQAEGYLTESQRHGKSGFSLTKLLARLRNSIRLIERPHGQHAVILEEDSPKYMENLLSLTASGSRQIYLTFPAESTFTEDNVSDYFNTFGQVEDVRIPCQQKRMFGFVTFASAETVRTILAKGNPHFVCGSRVLVKPYREKSKLVGRKLQERTDPFVHSQRYPEFDPELALRGPRLTRKQHLEADDREFELEQRRFVGMRLSTRAPTHPCSFASVVPLQISQDFPSEAHYDELLDVLNDHGKRINTKNNDQESEGLNLPDSPFSSLNS